MFSLHQLMKYDVNICIEPVINYLSITRKMYDLKNCECFLHPHRSVTGGSGTQGDVPLTE